MSLEEKNKATIRKGIEAVNERNLALLDELMASDFFDHTLQTRGLEGAKQFYALFFKGFPDFQMAIEDIVAEGDKVWVRLKSTGTHTGEFYLPTPSGKIMTLAPTGKKITIKSVNIRRVVEGKIIEGWNVTDSLDLLKELGVIEYKGFPDEVK